jgi:2-C-methyl-D-erythritol 4-phosphate cytidylyltransferase/2-C-methyl-D-erythritol 2,4-cyclodiphosphate synthase
LPKVGAILVAAGRGDRMGGLEKMMIPLCGEPVLLHSLKTFAASSVVDEIVVVTREDLVDRVRTLIETRAIPKVTRVVPGGETRAESSRHGLAALSRDVGIVLVHDGARPLVRADLIERVARGAMEEGAAIPGTVPVGTIKEESNGRASATLDRRRLREAQTPQGFRRDWLARAMAQAMREHFDPTDEASLLERAGCPVRLVDGDRSNIKITVIEDLAVAEALAGGRTPTQLPRIGIGHDVHRLTKDRPLILGGVHIPHALGLEGHSDADVLAHAICDALLGAACQGDLGDHFPDTDETWRGAPGRDLLARTVEILREVGYVPVNIDATVCAQSPTLSPFREAMAENLAQALHLPRERISVKFTTTERLGFEGREEGISATAVAMVGHIPWIAEMR